MQHAGMVQGEAEMQWSEFRNVVIWGGLRSQTDLPAEVGGMSLS